jgi:hypothetical protein
MLSGGWYGFSDLTWMPREQMVRLMNALVADRPCDRVASQLKLSLMRLSRARRGSLTGFEARK